MTRREGGSAPKERSGRWRGQDGPPEFTHQDEGGAAWWVT